jgi:signal transduction histidine kinase
MSAEMSVEMTDRSEGALEMGWTPRQIGARLLVGGLVLLGLLLSRRYNYLLFHSLVEIFSVVVAVSIFMLFWSARRFMENGYFLFMGIAYLFIGGLDLVHTLAYKGMGVFPDYGANLPTQLWIAARYVEALSLLVALLFVHRKLRSTFVFAGYALTSVLLLGSIYGGVFPDCFIEGAGLTPFKKVSEYIISFILVASILLLARRRRMFDARVFNLLGASIAVTIVSELAFTLYENVYGLPNLIGHFLKIVSGYLIYVAFVQIGLTQPYNLLFRDLKRKEETLQWQSEVESSVAELSTALLEPGSLEGISVGVLEQAKQLTGSAFGYVGYIDPETGYLICPTMTRDIWDECQVPDKDYVFESFGGLWGWVLEHREPLLTNNLQDDPRSSGVPAGHVPIQRFLSVPAIIDGELIGQIALVNAGRDYTAQDLALVKRLASLYAFALQRHWTERQIVQQKEVLESTLEALTHPFYVLNADDYTIEMANSAATSTEDLPEDVTCYMLTHRLEEPCGGADHLCPLEEVKASGAPMDVVHRHYAPDGSLRYVEVHGYPIFDEEGNVVRMIEYTLDITERKRAEKEIERYAAQLERSNQELEQFAYIASHDLQEPLRMVTGFLDLLERRYGEQLDAKAREYIAYAVDGAERMRQMVRSLLDLSRVGTQGQKIAPTDTEAVLERTLKALRRTIEEAGAEVTHDPLPTVMADEAQLAQVFQNLISNAIKFRREDVPPRVHISARRQDDQWRFSIADNGIGVDPEQADRIFEVFQRLHTRDEYEGTGIGLALCERILERHNGRIWVESEPGEGSTFYFTLSGT